MSRTPVLAVAALCLLLTACGPGKTAALPRPREPGPGDTGTICHMDMAEHTGPKGQVFLSGGDGAAAEQPLWFSSVRDTFTWLLMDDGVEQSVAAIWVNDMGHGADWKHPPAGAWVEARRAFFVVGSDKSASMDATAEIVPFSDFASAQAFVAVHGGRITDFKHIDRAVLESGAVR